MSTAPENRGLLGSTRSAIVSAVGRVSDGNRSVGVASAGGRADAGGDGGDGGGDDEPHAAANAIANPGQRCTEGRGFTAIQ